MDKTIIIVIAVTSVVLIYKALRNKSFSMPLSSEVLGAGFKCIIFIAVQFFVMIFLGLLRGDGKSLTNGALQLVYVIAISAIASIVIVILHNRNAAKPVWAILYIVSTLLNILLWELAPSLPE